MTEYEASKILSVLTVAYPSLADNNAAERVKLWASMFADEPYRLVNSAVRTFIASDLKGFPPSIGQLKDLCNKILEQKRMSASEAVALIVKATKNGLYGSVEEFDKLPPICQKIVVTPERLKDWASLSSDEVNTVIASQLRRAYDVQVEREKELSMLPSADREMIGQLRLGEQNEN